MWICDRCRQYVTEDRVVLVDVDDVEHVWCDDCVRYARSNGECFQEMDH